MRYSPSPKYNPMFLCCVCIPPKALSIQPPTVKKALATFDIEFDHAAFT